MGSDRDFKRMMELIEKTKMIPHIYRVFPFKDIISAVEILGKGENFGKLVITIDATPHSRL